MSELDIRPAALSDLPHMLRIQLTARDGAPPDWYQDGETAAVHRFAIEHESTMVAVQSDEVAGFAANTNWENASLVSHLYVKHELQSLGIGRRLLDAVLRTDDLPQAVINGGDYAASAVYVRAGMSPCWPLYMLTADAAKVARFPATGVGVVEANPDDEAWMMWDGELSGRRRSSGIAYLRRAGAGEPVWFLRDDDRVGYGQVQFLYRSPEVVEGLVIVGPLGARTHADARDSLLAAARWAARQPGAGEIEVMLPGPHPAFPTLLEAGFRIRNIQMFMATDPAPFGDPQVYVPAATNVY